MLSDTDVESAIRGGDVSIAYSFLPDGDGGWRGLDDMVRPFNNSEATNFFARSQTRSRVALTSGPLLKPLSVSRRSSKSICFEGHRSVVDLRRCPNGWPLLPGQAAVVFTNEYLSLQADYVGMILGRVSSYNDGLIVSASYVDSMWDGIVKVHLANTSRRTVRLALGTEVGRLFLFKTDGASADKSKVAHQGVHYGYTWPRIFQDRIDPFPQGSAPPTFSITRQISTANDLIQRYAGYGLVAVAGALLVGGLSLYGSIRTALDRSSEIGDVTADVTRLQESAPLAGAETIAWPEERERFTVDIALGTADVGIDAYAHAVIEARGSTQQPGTASAHLVRSGGATILRVTIERQPGASPPELADIRWVVVPR